MKNNIVAELTNIHEVHKKGHLGRGIGVVILDSGIAPHMDFQEENGSRIIAFADMVNGEESYYDDNGHGTHISGIVGGNGNASGGKYIGVAPECDIISVKVLDKAGKGSVGNVLKGIDWVIANRFRYNIRILNISVGTLDKSADCEKSDLVLAVERAWDEGIIVVVAAGNNGPGRSTITTPGISRKVITVGSSDDIMPMRVKNDMIKNYSGRGPTLACIMKPDIVAPGANIISCGNDKMGRNYTAKSGTSMSTPIVSGAIALLLEKYPNMTNKQVKIRLKNSARDLGYAHNRQGWGEIDIERLLQ